MDHRINGANILIQQWNLCFKLGTVKILLELLFKIFWHVQNTIGTIKKSCETSETPGRMDQN